MRNIVYFLLLTFFTQIYSDDQYIEDLYNSLKPELELFTRPFTVIDFDAETPYFTLRIAQDFPQATCVLAGRDSETLTNMLDTSLKSTNLKNIILLNKSLSAADLKNLAHSEHFDVMLAFNPNPPKNFFATAKNIASKVLTLNEQKSELKIVTGNVSSKVKPHWFSLEKPSISILSDEKNQIIEITPPGSLWSLNVTRAPGISLVTFLALQGSWPELAQLEKNISKLSWKFYKNLAPWNIFVTGSEVEVLPFSSDLNFPKQFTLDLLKASPAELKTLLTLNELQEKEEVAN